ncbi:hypothetical protein N7G274_006676 [Stereocaulon virgatum]|uniref:Flavin-containing monooxygenase n=1 Tax=Stereocaulon virgatum TaxID=373712 RepID=A0ABR4A8I3_9LECA
MSRVCYLDQFAFHYFPDMGSLPRPKIQRVAIIGAGPGGVVAAKYLLGENCFSKIDVYEQRASFGGVWNYSSDPQPEKLDIPSTNPHQPLEEPTWRSTSTSSPNGLANSKTERIPTFITPMYENLESNIPHTIMKHSDAPLENNALFPSRQTILQYLEEYAHDTRHLVHFSTQITSITLTNSKTQPTWLLQSRSLSTNKISHPTTNTTTPYDALILATGHHTTPHLPSIPGLRAWNTANPGTRTHSKHYRRPRPYRGKKVLVIGNAASGTDIARQIASVCKQPLLLSSRSENEFAFGDGGGVEGVGEVGEFLPPEQGKGVRAVRFKDGRVEGGIDAVLFATGYYYSFPFLESLSPPLTRTGERVEGTFQHIFWRHEATLAFMGLPSKIIPFRTFEGQAAVIARVWSGRLDLPSEEGMREWEEAVVREKGAGKRFHVLGFPRDFEYHNKMVQWAEGARDMDGGGQGKLPPKWNAKETWTRERFPAIKRAFAERGEARQGVRTVEALGFDYEGWIREHGREEKGMV